jgi:hypothetical protein
MQHPPSLLYREQLSDAQRIIEDVCGNPFHPANDSGIYYRDSEYSNVTYGYVTGGL